MFACLRIATFGLLVIAASTVAIAAEEVKKPKAPAVDDQAADFTLSTMDGTAVQLEKLAQKGPVVLMVLRGYPGYQCPFCTKQVGEFLGKAKEFQELGAQVVMVYPGPADGLKDHAKEFVTGKTLPDNIHFVLDPDMKMVGDYGLRWKAPKETAYPSTFVIDTKQKVRLAVVSQSHDGRSKASDVLDAVKKIKN